jgi:hypothetical protein
VTADKQLRARRRAEQISASRAKKTPDRRGPKQTEELAEVAELRGEIQPDCGRLSKSEVIPKQKTNLWFM